MVLPWSRKRRRKVSTPRTVSIAATSRVPEPRVSIPSLAVYESFSPTAKGYGSVVIVAGRGGAWVASPIRRANGVTRAQPRPGEWSRGALDPDVRPRASGAAVDVALSRP